MKCKSCQMEFEKYLKGQLSSDMMQQVKTHLKGCSECSAVFELESELEKMVTSVRRVQVNPFISTRVLNRIDEKNQLVPRPKWITMVQNSAASILLAVAVMVGWQVGSIYFETLENKTTSEVVSYLDDAQMESINLFVEN